MKNRLLTLSAFALLAATILAGCDSSTSSKTQASGTISGIVQTNGGGPSIRTLPNALIRIEDGSGTVVAEVTTDTSGRFSTTLPVGKYTIDPQRVINTDFFVPPGKTSISITTNQVVRDTLFYWNPLV